MKNILLASVIVLSTTTFASAESFLDSFNFDWSVKPIQSCEYNSNDVFVNSPCDNDGAKLQLDISRDDNNNDNSRDTHSHGKGPEKGRGHFEHGNGKGLGHYK